MLITKKPFLSIFGPRSMSQLGWVAALNLKKEFKKKREIRSHIYIPLRARINIRRGGTKYRAGAQITSVLWTSIEAADGKRNESMDKFVWGIYHE